MVKTARLKGQDFTALVERWSDLPSRVFKLIRDKNDATAYL